LRKARAGKYYSDVLRTVLVAISLLMALAASGVAAADEAKSQLSAAMILNIVTAPVDARSSYDAGLKESLARPMDSTGGEVLPDGSVRYGRTIITVRNPCPPGDHLELPPLPGRRR
jgi:hypothetical protein